MLIAYRNATIALADEVAYLEAGRVVATGSHDTLLADVPGYRDFVTAYERRGQAVGRGVDAADEPGTAA